MGSLPDGERLEAVVLQFLLSRPAPISEADLARSLEPDAPGEDETREAVEAAVLGLERGGLAHRTGGLISPTLAAVRLDELLSG
jgi:hypothetical protein